MRGVDASVDNCAPGAPFACPSRTAGTSLALIVSGGQTGADRGALDAALALSFPCGGWCPAGRRAEDGEIPLTYPLQELEAAGYRKRTIRNIQDSDATVIFCAGEPVGGSLLTLRTCERLGKPHRVIDMQSTSSELAAAEVLAWVKELRIAALNVAGPSEGRAPGTQAWVDAAMRDLIRLARGAA